MDMKRFFLYFITIAALALAGCGGGGGGTPGTSLQDQLDASDMEVTRLMGALMDAQDEATRLQGLIDASPTKTELQDRLVMANQTITNLQAQIDMLMPAGEIPNDMSNGIVGAIVAPSTPGDPSTARGVNLESRPGNAMEDTVTARSGDNEDDVTATILVGAPDGTQDELNKDDMMVDPDNADEMISRSNQFTMQGSAMNMGKGFSSSTHERMMMEGAQTDTINVITDRKDPGPLSFVDYYAGDNRAGVDGMANTMEPDNAGDAPLGRITLENDESNENFYTSLIDADDFPMRRDQTFMYDADDADTMDVNESERKFAGTYNDVAGTYECTTGDCAAGTDEDGKLNNLDGTWTFTPTDTKTMIPDVDHDSDYLVFGWWLRTNTDADDETTYGIGTFATGSDPYTVAVAVTGSAVYSGPAAGKYGRKTFNADGTVATLAVGHFTADARLTATFGQTTEQDIAPNQLYSISGTVGDFEDADSNKIDAGWTVNLMKAGFGASDSNNPRGTFTDDSTFGAATGGKGEWQGQFFGPDVDADDVAVQPTGVAGEFTDHFANGHVIGAFGATKE